MDPLAELVKIDPKSKVWDSTMTWTRANSKPGLDDVVMNCVNRVGVEVNTASKQILSYVFGLVPVLANNIIQHRNQNGPLPQQGRLKK